MNTNYQEGTESGCPARSKHKKVIHFSSGETLEEEDSEEEEEQLSSRPPFREPTERTRLSFKNLAIVVGRISLLTCDFLGERLAGAVGLNAAKHQYAIDQYYRDHKKTSSPAMTETSHSSPTKNGHNYGATGVTGCVSDPQESADEKQGKVHIKKGFHNRGYQGDVDYLK
ncbi:protein FAM177A1 [Mastacembelus armatus]|uniref:Protein FAM177A1-like n=1 Tax=Mastacembelus armatus TaxID=205130 RepID=A0A3Q3L791_9TELE|nr:protein FAM177A1-like [Mastacembelus armatus]